MIRALSGLQTAGLALLLAGIAVWAVSGVAKSDKLKLPFKIGAYAITLAGALCMFL